MAGSTVETIVKKILASDGRVASGDVVAAARISRQAVHRTLARMVAERKLVRVGQGRGAHYVEPKNSFHRSLARGGLEEDTVWQDVRRSIPRLERHAAAFGVFGYAFTEMLNNAIEHSESPTIDVHGQVDPVAGNAWFRVDDRGLGAFEKVREQLKLEGPYDAVEAISKGKTSTDPERHSGEGIFFTSKMGSAFSLEANGLVWTVDNVRDDQWIAKAKTTRGTRVHFEVPLTTEVTPKSVFDRYSHDFEFDTSRVVIKLFERGGEYVSRSEAKRVVVGLERFREVVVDFHRVESVGQGFADEIFRVWSRAHPDTRLTPERMIEPVAFMVERARRAAVTSA